MTARVLAAVAAISFALAGCDDADRDRYIREREAARIKFDRDNAYRKCIHGAVGYFGSASIDVVRHCEAEAEKEGQP